MFNSIAGQVLYPNIGKLLNTTQSMQYGFEYKTIHRKGFGTTTVIWVKVSVAETDIALPQKMKEF